MRSRTERGIDENTPLSTAGMSVSSESSELKKQQSESGKEDMSHAHADNYSVIGAFMIFIFPALGGLLFGYDIGATSEVLTQLEDADYSGTTWYDYVADTSWLQGLITSTAVFGAMIGSIIMFAIADDIGRKRTLLCAGVMYLCGALIQAYSGQSNFNTATGVGVLICGRCVYGLACGFAMHAAPAYIGEMAPFSIRGTLVALKEAFIVIGMLLGYSIGYSLQKVEGGWRWTYGCSGFMAVVMIIGVWQLPYSSRWLALKGRIEEAKASMRFVSPNITEAEMQEVINNATIASGGKSTTQTTGTIAATEEGSVDEASPLNGNGTVVTNKKNDEPENVDCCSYVANEYTKFQQPTIRAALIAGLGVVLLQQITGQPSVLYYADTLFKEIGLSGAASIGVSGFKLIMTLATTVTVDKYGRRLLLFIGCGIMLVSLILLGFMFLLPYTFGVQISILVALFFYIGGYQIGFGPIAWLFISEVFPLEYRGKAVSMAVVTNFFFNAIMTLLFALELELIGASLTFFIYGIILAGGMYFMYYRVPETKGLTLEEIEALFLKIGTRDLKEARNGESAIQSPLLNSLED